MGLFQGFSDTDMVELLRESSRQEVYDDGEVVFREGMPSSRMYVVLAGQVRITRNPGLEQEEELALLDPGECFGEMGLIDPSPRSARATSVGESTLLVVSEKALRHASSPVALKLYRNFGSILAARLRLTNEQIVQLTISDRRHKRHVRKLTRRRSVEAETTMRGVELHDADLRGVELQGADLRGAVLAGARLDHADLRNSDLRGVDLRDAQFLDANLSGVDLSGADLRGAVFRSTDFEKALFTGADTRDVTVEGPDLATTDGSSTE